MMTLIADSNNINVMAISKNIETYIKNSLIRGKLCRWNKNTVNVYITPVTAPVTNKAFLYSQVKKALAEWNKVLASQNICLNFTEITNANNADIIVHWVKVGRVYEGMCKYLSVVNQTINKISIDIGLPNEFSGKETTDLSIYCAIMHEFGHALGLGHGVEIDDIMFVPHQKNIQTPGENDIYVLNKIYK